MAFRFRYALFFIDAAIFVIIPVANSLTAIFGSKQFYREASNDSQERLNSSLKVSFSDQF